MVNSSQRLSLLAHLRRHIALPVLIAALAVSAGCRQSDRSEEAGAGGISKQEKPQVFTTFTVLADLARQVAGDRLSVNSIVKTGAEIHGYQPTPSDVERASSADLIVENGLGLELWARRFTAAAGNVPTVTLSDGMSPLLIEEDAYAGKPNPHAWMSPQAAQLYVDRLVEAFSQLDPEGASQYAANGESYKARLQELDGELRDSLQSLPPDKRLLVTCEGAFSYLARDYDLEEAYLWPVNAESQISPRRMGRLIERVKRDKVPAVFCETTVSDKAQREVARAAGSRFGGSFYVDSLSDRNGPAATLLDLQRHNVKLIQSGLSSVSDSMP